MFLDIPKNRNMGAPILATKNMGFGHIGTPYLVHPQNLGFGHPKNAPFETAPKLKAPLF